MGKVDEQNKLDQNKDEGSSDSKVKPHCKVDRKQTQLIQFPVTVDPEKSESLTVSVCSIKGPQFINDYYCHYRYEMFHQG